MVVVLVEVVLVGVGLPLPRLRAPAEVMRRVAALADVVGVDAAVALRLPERLVAALPVVVMLMLLALMLSKGTAAARRKSVVKLVATLVVTD